MKEREESYIPEGGKQEAAQLKKLNTLLNAKRRKLESLGKKEVPISCCRKQEDCQA